MLSTPFLLLFHDRVLAPRFSDAAAAARAHEVPETGKVILAGLGRVGQVVARLLHASGHEPTVLDDDPDHVEQSRKFGFRVFYGDATRLDLLQAAGAARAEFLIIALNDPEATTRIAATAVKHFPNLKIIARARDMRHLFELRDIGVQVIERETFESSLELGRATLAEITGDADRAKRIVRAFARHDSNVLAKLYTVHKNDLDANISASNELREQFARTLREDEAAIAARAKDPAGRPAA